MNESQIRVPLVRTRFLHRSYFIPCAFHYYEVINYMDIAIKDNEKFHSLGFPFHPLLSWLYFGALFYLQSMKAMQASGSIDSDTQSFMSDFFKSTPQESILVPGPLAAIIESIATSVPENDNFNIVSPQIPYGIGPVLIWTFLIKN